MYQSLMKLFHYQIYSFKNRDYNDAVPVRYPMKSFYFAKSAPIENAFLHSSGNTVSGALLVIISRTGIYYSSQFIFLVDFKEQTCYKLVIGVHLFDCKIFMQYICLGIVFWKLLNQNLLCFT